MTTWDAMHKEIDRRIAKMWKRFWSVSAVIKNKDMSIRIKINGKFIYNTCNLPCLTWALTEKLTNKLIICQNGIERSVNRV